MCGGWWWIRQRYCGLDSATTSIIAISSSWWPLSCVVCRLSPVQVHVQSEGDYTIIIDQVCWLAALHSELLPVHKLVPLSVRRRRKVVGSEFLNQFWGESKSLSVTRREYRARKRWWWWLRMDSQKNVQNYYHKQVNGFALTFGHVY